MINSENLLGNDACFFSSQINAFQCQQEMERKGEPMMQVLHIIPRHHLEPLALAIF